MSGFSSLGKNYTGNITSAGEPGNAGSVGPFGTSLVSELDPTGQATFVYGVSNISWVTSSSGINAHVSANDGLATLESGTSMSGSTVIRLARKIKYRAGQGGICRLTAVFSTGSLESQQLVGIGNNECGYFFAQSGSNFGILHRERSKVEIRKFTITAPPAGAATVVVTLANCVYNVTINGGGSANQTSHQISTGDYTKTGIGWHAESINGEIYFMALHPGPQGGTFSMTVNGTPIATVSTAQAGVLPVQTFISQSNWNIDKVDGKGVSQFKLDPRKGNVYGVGYQYLGFGDPIFSVEDSRTGAFTNVHRIQTANKTTLPVLSNPQMSATWEVYNSGSISSVSVTGASAATFVEGKINRSVGTSFAYTNTVSSVTTVIKPALTIRANRVFQNRTSYGELELYNVSVGTDTGNASTTRLLRVLIYKNARLVGPVNYQHVDPVRSMTAVDTAATSINILPETQLLKSYLVPANSSVTLSLHNENFFLGTGERLTVAVQAVANDIATVSVSTSWFEDI